MINWDAATPLVISSIVALICGPNMAFYFLWGWLAVNAIRERGKSNG